MRASVVYLDTVLFYNVLADDLLLLATGRLAGLPLKRQRIFIAALLGGLYAAAVFLPGTAFLDCWWIKLLAAAVMVWIAFGKSGYFLRKYLLFLLVSAGFAGVEMALGGGIAFHVPLFFVSFALCYLLLGVVFRGSGRSGARDLRLETTVTRGEHRVSFAALADSGNTLSDPLTGEAVLVAEFIALKALFTDEESFALKTGKSLPSLPLETLAFHSLGGGGTLPAFRADRVIIGKYVQQNALVAVHTGRLGGDGTFRALWGGEESCG